MEFCGEPCRTFFMVYMLKRLGLSISFIIGLSIVSQMMNFLFLKIWGRYTDRFSNKSVLAISGPLFIASILAWTLKYTSPSGEFDMLTLNLQQWDFFFALAFIIGLYALHRLAMIKEQGEVEENIVVQEFFTEVRTQVRTLSSFEGIKQMVSFPIIIIKNITERITPNDDDRQIKNTLKQLVFRFRG
jgi:hypothetical protein